MINPYLFSNNIKYCLTDKEHVNKCTYANRVKEESIMIYEEKDLSDTKLNYESLGRHIESYKCVIQQYCVNLNWWTRSEWG